MQVQIYPLVWSSGKYSCKQYTTLKSAWSLEERYCNFLTTPCIAARNTIVISPICPPIPASPGKHSWFEAFPQPSCLVYSCYVVVLNLQKVPMAGRIFLSQRTIPAIAFLLYAVDTLEGFWRILTKNLPQYNPLMTVAITYWGIIDNFFMKYLFKYLILFIIN